MLALVPSHLQPATELSLEVLPVAEHVETIGATVSLCVLFLYDVGILLPLHPSNCCVRTVSDGSV
jgi:hypothetical protein